MTAPTGDPRLKTKSWSAIKAYWRNRREPECQSPDCLLPGIPIRYDGPRGPDSLDVGHLLPRDVDMRRTWSLHETRPEHQRCNRAHGSRYGHAKHGHRTPSHEQPRQTRDW